ncbi:glycosyltransferase family 2 protein [Cobetia amphilecti]|uniref:glycosyltransferase family 2 protein n=1 Tax=Cobetia amphilecti TaxID=1055104 RepID=UPI0026E3E6D1|nr:glycosyltransferase family 2 protein [Cobetia amphilecti]MDO6815019.1 glycosyltransferase family 2 protein [Cobetia amphilecti]
MRNSWSTVTTVLAHDISIASFIAYHLSVGATEINLYLDAPSSEQVELFSQIRNVRITLCDAQYWRSKGISRPEDHRRRQVINANDALSRTQAEWLTHIDIDEFISSTNIRDEIANCRTDILRLRPVENYFSVVPKTVGDVFSSHFHKPFPKYKEGEKYRHDIGAWCVSCPLGLEGHTYGKIFVRVASNLKVDIHKTIPEAPETEAVTRLCHFYSLGYNDWLRKNLRRLHAKRLSEIPRWKRRHLNLFAEALSDPNHNKQLFELFSDALLYDQNRENKLDKYAGIITNDLDIPRKVSYYFGQHFSEKYFQSSVEVIDKEVDILHEMKNLAVSNFYYFK